MTDARDIIRTWPADSAERLVQLVDLYDNRPDGDLAIEAAVAGGEAVGLTWGDLRAIAERVGA